MTPLVSVIIPLFNGEETIARAISSVERQYYRDIELIIIDDCSQDDSFKKTKSIAKSSPLNIRLLKNNKNLGISKNQNKGLKKSKGKYIARLDQDDAWISNHKISKQVEILENNKKIGLVGTWAKVINESGPDFSISPPTQDDEIRNRILYANMFMAPSVMFRRSLADKIGDYREDLKHGTEDYEYWLRIGKRAGFSIIPEYMLEYHFHAKSYSVQNKANATKEHLEIIKKYRNDYPNYAGARRKNLIQYNLLRIGILQKIYGLIAPKLAGRIYS